MLDGGAGQDRLVDGAGDDVFVFGNGDMIYGLRQRQRS